MRAEDPRRPNQEDGSRAQPSAQRYTFRLRRGRYGKVACAVRARNLRLNGVFDAERQRA
jgi:hypothetical protein